MNQIFGKNWMRLFSLRNLEKREERVGDRKTNARSRMPDNLADDLERSRYWGVVS
jgi:hypothetical protein